MLCRARPLAALACCAPLLHTHNCFFCRHTKNTSPGAAAAAKEQQPETVDLSATPKVKAGDATPSKGTDAKAVERCAAF